MFNARTFHYLAIIAKNYPESPGSQSKEIFLGKPGLTNY